MTQHDFIQFLQSLAPEGETALIVLQSPTLKDKQLQFHADGAIKCTWPAFLPTHTFRATQSSLYGNTASFVISRFTDGRLSASAANCDYVMVMVLDDIGTKSKDPPLPPTWVMETSPGNFQYGYVFSEQPTKGEYCAAINAIADAGYTDPGARNPVRNFRIPGSVNLKPGLNHFPARLVRFDAAVEYTLTQICEGLGVVPGPADGEGLRPIRISDDGADDVTAWLSGRGLVLSRPNLEGWMGVVCPNAAAHTDGNPEGRYLPTTRAFVCWHSHCQHLHSKEFLDWVAAEGGPAHAPGLRDELLAFRMAATLEKLTPTADFPDEAAAIVAEVERKELGRLEKSEWYARFAYIQSDESYFDMLERREISRATFNALYRHIDCKSIHNAKRRIEASYCFDEHRQAMGAPSLVGITYAAGEDRLAVRDGLVYGNRWRDARPDVKTRGADVSPWLAHVEHLLPNADERRHVLDAMAFKLQNPRGKINHAILHGGVQGCGKDTMWAPFFWAVCGPDGINKGQLDNDGLNSTWGYALESEILVLNELKEPEARDRRALANKLKPIIAGPPDTLVIARKNLHPYEMVNRLMVLAFTNDPAPITLESQDRRWFCTWSHVERMTTAASDALWGWYKAGGFEAVAGWLYARDVSAFNPSAMPMVTEFKLNMIENAMSAAEAYLVDLLRSRKGEFAKGVIGSPFHAICDRLAGGAPNGVKLPQAALLHALREAGWEDCGRIASVDYPSKKQIFRAPGVRGYSKSDLRRMVEEPATPTLRLVSKPGAVVPE